MDFNKLRYIDQAKASEEPWRVISLCKMYKADTQL